MVDISQQKKKLIDLFEQYFDCYELQSLMVGDDLRVNVRAIDVRLQVPTNQIPVPLGKIDGDLDISNRELTSLINCAHTVTGNFDCHRNRLTSLAHGPAVVEGPVYGCSYNSLKNFEGAPPDYNGLFVGADQTHMTSIDSISPHCRMVIITYQENLPLLKILNNKKFNVRVPNKDESHPVQKILEKYAGQGQSAALVCAAELADAGYKDNARW